MSVAQTAQTTYKTKILRILALTGWSHDHLADLLDVSDRAFRKWLRRTQPQTASAALIDEIYDKIVLHYQPEITCTATALEGGILKRRIKSLPTCD